MQEGFGACRPKKNWSVNKVVENGRIPEITRLVGFKHATKGMGSEGSQCNGQKSRCGGRDAGGTTGHDDLLGSDLELFGELLEEALNGP